MKTKVLGIALMIATLCGFGVSAQESCCKESKESAANCSKKARPQHPDFFQGITLTADQQAKIDALNAECAKEAKAAKCEKAAKADCCKEAKCGKAEKCDKAAKCEKAAKADCCKADTAKCGKAAKCEKVAKADCCKADTAKCGNHNKKGMRRVARFHKEKHMEYIGKVKEILTPEQYEVFLKNVESAAPQCKEGKACQKAEGKACHKAEGKCGKGEGKCGKAEGKACKEGKTCQKAEGKCGKGEGKCSKAEKAGCCKDGDNSSKCDKACSKKDAK
ncbi:MAG: hypothetical protein PUD39_08495 [Bacteroidales bacterium]|nr:hypothetical protein [Bacteroidales bacterium]